MKRLMLLLITAFAVMMSFSQIAQAKGYHAFATPAYDVARGGVRVTKEALAANPAAYYRDGAYAETLRYLGLTDGQFRQIVKGGDMVPCVGQVTSLRLDENTRSSIYTRNCNAGEMLLVQRSTGRVILSFDCLNPTFEMAVERPRIIPVTSQNNDNNPPVSPPPPPPKPGDHETPGPCKHCEPPPPPCGCGSGHNSNNGHFNHDNPFEHHGDYGKDRSNRK